MKTIKCLDLIFSPYNKLIPYNKIESLIYIINSEEELNEMNSFGCKPNINFSKYTLVGGVVYSMSSYYHDKVDISLTERENDYLLYIKWKHSSWTAAGNFYFWRLYHKLNKEKNVTIELEKFE